MKHCTTALAASLVLITHTFLFSPHAKAHDTHAAQAHETKSLLPVTAYAEISQAPDHVEITAGVISRGKSAQDTARDNAERMNQVFAALSQVGIKETEIKTTSLSLQPRLDYSQKRRPRILGYEAENRITITHNNPSKVGEIIERLISAGANDVDDVRFFIKDSDILQDKVRDEAIKKARKKAAAIAASAGISLGKLHAINTGENSSQNAYEYDEVIVTSSRKSRSEADNLIAPISHGEHKISARVTLTYELP